MTNNVSVKVPASTANIGPGYDVLGIALTLYNDFSIELSDKIKIEVVGSKSDKSVPLDENNLVYHSIKVFYDYINKPCPTFKVTINCHIPMASGLGSSSTAIVGGLCVANKFEGYPLSKEEIVHLACQIEGHPDNTTPALLGGFVISSDSETKHVTYKKLSWPDEWKFIICHPNYKLSTEKARSVLPKQVDLSDAIFNIGSCAFLVSAVCTKDKELLKLALKDKLHQPYRATLVKGFDDILKNLKQIGIIGAFLSGAGPSIAIIHDKTAPNEIVDKVKQILNSYQVECDFYYPTVDNDGVLFN